MNDHALLALTVGKEELAIFATGIPAYPDVLTFSQWEKAVRYCGRMGSAARWALGDLLIHGEARWGEKYAQAMEMTELSYESVSRCVAVAKGFEFRRRRRNLSWSHHREVLALMPDQQDAHLERAEGESWSSAMLREHVKQAHAAKGKEPGEPQEGEVLAFRLVVKADLAGLVRQELDRIKANGMIESWDQVAA